MNLTEIIEFPPLCHAALIDQECDGSGKTTEASSDGILWIYCLMDLSYLALVKG